MGRGKRGYIVLEAAWHWVCQLLVQSLAVFARGRSQANRQVKITWVRYLS